MSTGTPVSAGPPGPTSLRSFVASQKHLCDELPLVHTSRCEFLNDIVRDGALNTTHCSTYNESLLYFFYGRPALRPSKGKRNGEKIPLCPVCFVFKPRRITQGIHRVMPCDSGAVHAGLFVPDITSSDLSALELDPRITSARRWVRFMFETNANYFVGNVRTGIVFTPGTAESRLYSLVQGSGPAAYDDRKSAIEVQIRKAVSLRGSLLGVVCHGSSLRTSIFARRSLMNGDANMRFIRL